MLHASSYVAMGTEERQTVILIVLDFVGLLLNVWLLYSIRSRKKVFNAIGVLQICKTIMVILAIAMLVWLEFIDCGRKSSRAASVCFALTGALENVFFHSACWTFLSVAIVRRKVCECQGQASVLVTPHYAAKVLALCLVPVFSFSAVTTTMTLSLDPDHSGNSSSPVAGRALVIVSSPYVYMLTQLILVNGIPLLAGTVVYLYILQLVRHTVRNVKTAVSRERKTSSKIISSVVVLTLTNGIMWWPYIILRFLSLYMSVNGLVFVYWRVFVLIVHPFGEGLLQSWMQQLASRPKRIPSRMTRTAGDVKVDATASPMDQAVKSPRRLRLSLSDVLEEQASTSESIVVIDDIRSPTKITTHAQIEHKERGNDHRNPKEFQQWYDDGGKPVFQALSMSHLDVETLAFSHEATGWTQTKVAVHRHARDHAVTNDDAVQRSVDTRQHSEKQQITTTTQLKPTIQQGSQLPPAARFRWKKAMTIAHDDVIEVESNGQPTESAVNRRKSTLGNLWGKLFTATKVVRRLSSLKTSVSELSTADSRRRIITRQRSKPEMLDVPRKHHSYTTVYARDDSELNTTSRYGFGRKNDKARLSADGKTRHISVCGVPGAYLAQQRDSRNFFMEPEVRVAAGRDCTGSGPQNSKNKRKKHWLLDATKEECVAKLEELNDYF